MKKLFALLLAVIMIVSVFSACNNQNNPTEPASDTPNFSSNDTPSGDDQPSRADLKNSEVYPLDVKDDLVFDVIAYADDVPTNDFYVAKLWEEITGVKINFLDWTEEQYGIALRDNDLPDAASATMA